MILETERLFLREMTQEDIPALCRIMQDEDVMYAYEGIYNDSEVQVWLTRSCKAMRSTALACGR